MIVPRWEWRTFGEAFGKAEERLAALAPTRVSESDELYVVSSRGEGNVKVRGGVLDVKRLEQVSDDGLEQWRPVAKAEFPIAAEVASKASRSPAVPASGYSRTPACGGSKWKVAVKTQMCLWVMVTGDVMGPIFGLDAPASAGGAGR